MFAAFLMVTETLPYIKTNKTHCKTGVKHSSASLGNQKPSKSNFTLEVRNIMKILTTHKTVTRTL